MTKTLEQRIREAMAFPKHQAYGEAAKQELDVGLEDVAFIEGAQWQHAELTRDWLPLMIEALELVYSCHGCWEEPGVGPHPVRVFKEELERFLAEKERK